MRFLTLLWGLLLVIVYLTESTKGQGQEQQQQRERWIQSSRSGGRYGGYDYGDYPENAYSGGRGQSENWVEPGRWRQNGPIQLQQQRQQFGQQESWRQIQPQRQQQLRPTESWIGGQNWRQRQPQSQRQQQFRQPENWSGQQPQRQGQQQQLGQSESWIAGQRWRQPQQQEEQQQQWRMEQRRMQRPINDDELRPEENIVSVPVKPISCRPGQIKILGRCRTIRS